MPELIEWLSDRTPESVSALSDASKTDPLTVSASLAGLQANDFFSDFRNLDVPSLLVYGGNDPAIFAAIPGKNRFLSPTHPPDQP